MASWGIGRSLALGHCLEHRPYHLVVPDTVRQEGGPRQAHSRSEATMVDRRCSDSLVEAAGHHSGHPGDLRVQRVLARRRLFVGHPPPSSVLSIPCEFP
jgi:hypothetical protein